MNGRELLEAMSFIDDELVQSSEMLPRKASWKRWVSLAACICILALCTLSFLRFGRGGATEGTTEEYAAEAQMAMGADASPAAEPAEAAEETRAATPDTAMAEEGVRSEAAATALVRLEAPTETGFTAAVLEMSYPFTEAEIIHVELSGDCAPGELIPGMLYSIEIEFFDEATATARVYAIEARE